ncbi:YveK family protein [Alkalihalobacterium bogoriense]|uniref:YveK family protein n=1 Tax=Alkalihalobacterium bogoriense TaxID=246272 RepID=UPI00047DDD66|nr:Wzz/FepE/Etk N-terminal domain-containing protein [Alkalihalobacterium bogoriense]
MENHVGRKATEINIKAIYQLLKKKWWMIALITFFFSAAGWYYTTYHTTPIYESSSRIIINDSTNNFNTLRVVIRETAVMERVIHELDLNRTVDGLRGQIAVQSVDNSQIVNITVYDTNPELAALIANKTAHVYKDEVKDLLDFTGVSILSEAQTSGNVYPINQNHRKIHLVAFMVGLVGGIGFVFLLDSLDNTLRSEREIEKLLGVPVIGSISKITKRSLADGNQIKQEKQNLRGETIGS